MNNIDNEISKLNSIDNELSLLNSIKFNEDNLHKIHNEAMELSFQATEVPLQWRLKLVKKMNPNY